LRHGAYGISINGIAGLDELLVESEPSWPSIRLEVDLEQGSHANEFVDDRSAALNLKTGGRLTVDRSKGLARFATGRPLSNDELIHPFMAPVAAIVAHWERRVAFHAGALAIDGAAWGVLGTREAGKSSLLAWLSSRNGIDIVADDVLVLLDGHVFSGPRTIDLRESSAERLGGEAIGVAGARPRWRVRLPPIAATLPFRGWIVLAWGDEIRVDELPPRERLPLLMNSLALRMSIADPEALLPLAALQAIQLTRPPDWDRAGDAATCLTSAVGG
jgi:hypothetical protein